MAAHAELPELTLGLLLAALVHRDEDRIQCGIRVHAALPFAVVLRVAGLASLWVA
jgi:hypothetical protein